MQDTTEPASCINWHDAKAYVAWLSQKTGQSYRLLSEAEWEYAARGGSQLRLVSAKREGDMCQYANIVDRTAKVIFTDWDVADCSDSYIYTSPVGTYAANSFGLYDMLGNVAEWVEDCWHSNYAGAPTDGSVWTSRADCSYRMLRGGSWLGSLEALGVASRGAQVPDDRDGAIGFRVARDLGS
jgi:formylglycine-generating enzyme required for sulfatase activity